MCVCDFWQIHRVGDAVRTNSLLPFYDMAQVTGNVKLEREKNGQYGSKFSMRIDTFDYVPNNVDFGSRILYYFERPFTTANAHMLLPSPAPSIELLDLFVVRGEVVVDLNTPCHRVHTEYMSNCE